jgi:hypothetical protein
MSVQVMEVGTLAKLIKMIGRQKVRIDNMIQTAAVQAIAQSIVFRNSTPAAQLFEAVGVSSRRDALVKYFEMFGNLCWSKREKKVIFYDVAKVENKPELAWNDEYSAKVAAYVWHKAKPEPKLVSSYDVEEKVSQLIDNLRKSAKRGITLENAALLDSVESLYVKYVASTQDAKDKAKMAATPALEGEALDAAKDEAKDAARTETPAMSDREALAVQMKDGLQLAAA